MDWAPSEPLRLLLVISNLSRAGAQQQLLTLAKFINSTKIHIEVCSLSKGGELEAEFKKAGIQVWHVTKGFKYDFTIFLRFAKLCRRLQSQVVYSYLDFATLVARIGGKLAGVPVIISSERSTDYRLPGMKETLDRWTRNLSDMIIANSHAGKRFLIRDRHVPEHKVAVVCNSMDPARLLSQQKSGDVRRHFSIPDNAILIGMAAERRPEKNFDLFFSVAEEVTCRHPEAWFLHVGGVAPTHEEHADWVSQRHQELIHKDRVIMGERFRDIGAWYRDIDILMLTSNREGFSNVVMEGMASGLPAVVTDVGDNGQMIDDHGGFLTPVKEPEPMISALSRLITDHELQQQMGEYNRKKAETLFSVERMTSDTEKIILDLYRSKTQKSQ